MTNTSRSSTLFEELVSHPSPSVLEDVLSLLSSPQLEQITFALEMLPRFEERLEPARRHEIAAHLLSIRTPLPPELHAALSDALSPLLDVVSSAELLSSPVMHVLRENEVAYETLFLTVATVGTMHALWDRSPVLLARCVDSMRPVQIAMCARDMIDVILSEEGATMREDALLLAALCAAIERAVEHLTLSPTEGCELARTLLEALSSTAAIWPVLELCCTAWAALAADDALLSHLRRLALAEPRFALHVTRLLERRGARETLRLMCQDPRLDGVLWIQALMRSLAGCGAREDIDLLLDHAMDAPELLADTMIEALLIFHHRGIFVERSHLEILLALFLSTSHTPANHLVQIAYVWRRELGEVLAAVSPDDWRWRRYAALLEELEGGEVILADLILHTSSASHLEAFADVARRLASPSLATSLLARLLEHPAIVTPALLTCASFESFEPLWALTHREDRAFDALPIASQALVLDRLWHLAPSEEVRLALSSSMQPSFIRMTRIEDSMTDAHQDMHTLRLLCEVRVEAAPVEERLQELFVLLCRHAPADISSLLKRVMYTLLDALPETRRAEASFWRDAAYSHEEMSIPEEIVQELGVWVRRVNTSGARSVSASGLERELVQDVLLDYVCEHEPPAPHHVWLALEAIPTPLDSSRCARLVPLLRHHAPRVRRSLVRVLAKSRAPGLLVRFYHYLEEHEDAETLRAVIEALDDPQMTWAASAVASGLDHPNMNIKLTAARALRRVGRLEQVDAILRLLARHDHERLRGELLIALEHIAGSSWRALISAKHDSIEDMRGRELLQAAMHEPLPIVATPQEEKVCDDPVLWFTSLTLLPLQERARHIHALEQLDASPQRVERFLPMLLQWCRTEVFALHRAAIFEWSKRHLDASSLTQRVKLLERLRAIPPAPLSTRPSRLDLYELVGALLTSEDRSLCLADARIGASPELLRQTVARLLGVDPGAWHARDMAGLELLETLAGMGSINEMERALIQNTSSVEMLDALTHIFVQAVGDFAPAVQLTLLTALLNVRAVSQHLACHSDPSPRYGPLPVTTLFANLECGSLVSQIDAAHTLLTTVALTPDMELELLLHILPLPLLARAPSLRAPLAAWLARHHRDTDEVCAMTREPTKELAITLGTLCLAMREHAARRAIPLMVSLWERLRTHEDDESLDLVGRLSGTLRSMDAMTVLDACITRIESGSSHLVALIGGKLVESPLTARLFHSPGVREREDGVRLLETLLAPALSRQGALSGVGVYVDEKIDEFLECSVLSVTPRGFDEEEILAMLQSEEDVQVLQAIQHVPRHPHEAIAHELQRLIAHRDGGIRSRAYRRLRDMGESAQYLIAATKLLQDPRREVQRSALRTLGFARHAEALPEIFVLLFEPTLNAQVMETLSLIGEPARRFLRKRRAHTRPDRRHVIDDALEFMS